MTSYARPWRLWSTRLYPARVARQLDAIIAVGGRPLMIVSDNGTELTSLAMARIDRYLLSRLPFLYSPIFQASCGRHRIIGVKAVKLTDIADDRFET